MPILLALTIAYLIPALLIASVGIYLDKKENQPLDISLTLLISILWPFLILLIFLTLVRLFGEWVGRQASKIKMK